MSVRFIAEIGLNHNGSLALLYELVRKAREAGADAVKFQLGWRSDRGELNELLISQIADVLRICRFWRIDPMFSIFTPEALQLARDHELALLKVASRTAHQDPQLVDQIIALGRPTIISTGMSESATPTFGSHPHVEYLWCRSKYPTFPWNLHGFPQDFRTSEWSGYSDHTPGIEMPLLAIARGAGIVEKHFTLDRSDGTIRDHALSATPEEFNQMVSLGRAMAAHLEQGI